MHQAKSKGHIAARAEIFYISFLNFLIIILLQVVESRGNISTTRLKYLADDAIFYCTS